MWGQAIFPSAEGSTTQALKRWNAQEHQGGCVV